ncbi:DNA/RNA helicase domain-containing protein [Turicibacter bilis]|uniref:DNA/RNA helicase domain-containing protein n=1 Tax=Turicibacter bilis TaxID=2735723 RepID=UPI0031B9AD31
MNQRCGELIQVKDLKIKPKDQIVSTLSNFITSLKSTVEDSQLKSWKDCINYLKGTFWGTNEYDEIYVLFEYCLPLTSYRRPDVILLFNNLVLVLEFKRKDVVLEIDKSQLRGYLNQLRNYHQFSHDNKLDIQGALVVTGSSVKKIYNENGIDIIEGDELRSFLDSIAPKLLPMELHKVKSWVESDYMPLLSIMLATRKMFLRGEIPQIKNIEEGDIKETQEYILKKINENNDKKRIFFLTGVPGAGKTLVLLNLLYELNNSICKSKPIEALFTSGNAPLISVLTYILSGDKETLDGEAFIKNISDIKANYDKAKNLPQKWKSSYRTILFDESQRAWDLDHMSKYDYKVSEPELLLRLQNKAYQDHGSTNMVCSYGEGQSIYFGEESGFELWAEVLNKKDYLDWEVYYPETLKKYFENRPKTHMIKNLFMEKSIRGNFIDINPFINAILDVDLEGGKKASENIISSGFDIKISGNFDKVKEYLEQYRSQSSDKFYGLVCSSSSSSKATLKHFIPTCTKILTSNDNQNIGKWYVKDCCNLTEAVSEFGCQGLELNIPIVIFGGDYLIKEGKWLINPTAGVKNYKNKDEILKNIYRVLLSRGRKGLILFIPNEFSDLNETYEFFKNLGIEELK